MSPLATLILTSIDLMTEIAQRRRDENLRGQTPSHRTKMAEATLADFRAALASAIREGRDVTTQESNFWFDRINQDRAELRQRSTGDFEV
jgi:hypothetical protein